MAAPPLPRALHFPCADPKGVNLWQLQRLWRQQQRQAFCLLAQAKHTRGNKKPIHMWNASGIYGRREFTFAPPGGRSEEQALRDGSSQSFVFFLSRFCFSLLFFFNIQSDSATLRTASRLWSSALRLTGFSKIIKRKIHKKNCSLPRNYGTRLQEKWKRRD